MALASRLRRSAALGALGVDAVRARGTSPAAARARQRVAERLGDLRGLPQKIGQMLSLAEIDSGETRYTRLTEGGPPAPSSQSFQWIADGLGRPLDAVFSRLERTGTAASLGQVHRGQLLDGRDVAVKVQFPGIGESVETDLGALAAIAAPATAGRTGFDLQSYRDELRGTLARELDYHAEAAALRRAAARRHDVPGLHTPEPIDGLCTARVLTMTWIDGVRIAEARTWPRHARRDALEVLLATFLRGAFVWREVHADPHAGNLRFLRTRAGAEVGLLDFGCTRTIAPGECAALWTLATAGDTLSPADLAAAWAGLGFPPQVTDGLAHRLPGVTRILFEPFHHHGEFDATRWQPGDRLAAALGDDRWTFRTSGPAALLYVIRAFHGVVAYARALDAPLDWRRALTSLPAPDLTVLDAVPRASAASPLLSRSLRVEARRDDRPAVSITMPAAAVGHLEDLVPADLLPRIARLGVSLAALSRTAMAAGAPAGPVVTVDDGDLHVRVWLE